MSRWWFVLVLTVASATARAQPAPPAAQTTARAQAEASATEQRAGKVATQRAALAKKYEEQLKAIDRIKQQRPSWRRDRELRDNLAEAQETAAALTAATSDLTRAQTALATARRSFAIAVDAELVTGPSGGRAQQLAQWKAQLAPPAPKAPGRRIVLPDTAIDPLADPEELDQQAAALRESEAELSRQVVGLDKNASELDEVAKLRKEHERADVLAHRDDDQPHRTATQSTGRGAGAFEDSAGTGFGGAPPTTSGTPDPSSIVPTPPSSYETEARVVLADVIDASTIEALTRAQRTGDPAQRAIATKKTRDAVAARLEQLRKKRAEIEAAAKYRRIKR